MFSDRSVRRYGTDIAKILKNNSRDGKPSFGLIKVVERGGAENHSNLIVYDPVTKTIERYEPNGSLGTAQEESNIKDYYTAIASHLGAKYEKVLPDKTSINSYGCGHCHTWTTHFMEIRAARDKDAVKEAVAKHERSGKGEVKSFIVDYNKTISGGGGKEKHNKREREKEKEEESTNTEEASTEGSEQV